MSKRIIMPKGTSELVDSARMCLAHAEHLIDPLVNSSDPKISHRAALVKVEIISAGRDLDRVPTTYKSEVRTQLEKEKP
jgi:hypothetical protein